ncbi:B-cell receptor CD22-like isoform X2 [Toxotes jaculatrix]|nr:B-cell receptor CD22-like isoform X2 [Toxotes jaculatrix]
MKEGDSVNLTCINSCDGGNFSSAFTWFKNGEPINEGPVFYLRNISSTNSGNYTCSLTTHKETTSGVINIDVEYGPKNTSGSVRPSTEVDAGSNITLACSSHANPSVENYTWFKIVGDDDIKKVGNKTELHMREVFPGQYFCTATNKHGSQNSSTVTLKVKVSIPHSTFTRDAFIVAAVTVLVIVTIVVVIRRFNKKRTRAPETYCEEEIQSATYINWPMSDNSKSHEGNMCEETTIGVIYAAVDFNTKGKSNMQQQQMDSNYDDEGVIYSTVCRDQILKTS